MYAMQTTTRADQAGTPHLDGAPDDRATFPCHRGAQRGRAS
jgi:hypothetical protein